jgi:hypothetical protein
LPILAPLAAGAVVAAAFVVVAAGAVDCCSWAAFSSFFSPHPA